MILEGPAVQTEYSIQAAETGYFPVPGAHLYTGLVGRGGRVTA
jgi:hypothetical protein